MLLIKWEALRESGFAVFYILTERNMNQNKASKWTIFRSFLLYLIDVGQVFRALIVPEFGWSTEMVSFARNFDIVLSLVQLTPRPLVTSAACFIICVTLVISAFADFALVMHLFEKGRTSRMWPVVALRHLITILVNAFFVTVLSYLLFPLNCFQPGNTLSNLLNGDTAPCTPWASPMVAITVPSLLLAAAFAVGSLTVALLSFEVNPLAQMPGDCYTGRVEFLWTVVRITVTLARYLSRYITPVGVLVLLLLEMSLVLGAHNKFMPFHLHDLNLFRSGVYAGCLWLVVASFVTLSDDDSSQTSLILEWALVAVSVIAYCIGALAAERQRRTTLSGVKRLRSEFTKDSSQWSERLASQTSAPASGAAAAGAPAAPGTGAGSVVGPVAAGVPGRILMTTGRRRDPYTEFFDNESRMIRAFDSARGAQVAIRMLLYEKDERDVPFLMFLLQRALEEHPDAKDLVILDLVFLRFVFRDKHAAAWQEKAAKMGSGDLSLDLKYTLYAVDRKAFQYDAGVNIGKEGISAINLMEFSGKMAHARKMHAECIARFKALWKTAIKCKSQSSLSMATELITHLSKASESATYTQQCYEELLEKFPSSASLRRDYANFCDVVLNDYHKAEYHNSRAELLETGEEAVDDPQEHLRLEMAERMTHKTGSVASSTVSYRTQQRQFMLSWSQTVMATQVRDLRNLNWFILGLGLLLMLVSICGFLVLEYYLYFNVMVNRLSFLSMAKDLRLNIYQAVYELRTMHLLANQHSTDPSVAAAIEASRSVIHSSAQYVGSLHTQNYLSSPTSSITNFFLNANYVASTVYPGVPTLRTANTSFWQLGNDFVAAMGEASQITVEELRDPNYDFMTMGMSKRAVVYLYSNVAILSSAMRGFLDLIMSEILFSDTITNSVIDTLVIIESILIAVIAVLVLRYVSSVFPNCQQSRVAGELLDDLPVLILRKIQNFYLKSEKNMILMNDEDAAKEELEHTMDMKPSTQSVGKDAAASDLEEEPSHPVRGPSPASLASNAHRPLKSKTKCHGDKTESCGILGHSADRARRKTSFFETSSKASSSKRKHRGKSKDQAPETSQQDADFPAHHAHGTLSLLAAVSPLTVHNLELHLAENAAEGYNDRLLRHHTSSAALMGDLVKAGELFVSMHSLPSAGGRSDAGTAEETTVRRCRSDNPSPSEPHKATAEYNVGSVASSGDSLAVPSHNPSWSVRDYAHRIHALHTGPEPAEQHAFDELLLANCSLASSSKFSSAPSDVQDAPCEGGESVCNDACSQDEFKGAAARKRFVQENETEVDSLASAPEGRDDCDENGESASGRSDAEPPAEKWKSFAEELSLNWKQNVKKTIASEASSKRLSKFLGMKRPSVQIGQQATQIPAGKAASVTTPSQLEYAEAGRSSTDVYRSLVRYLSLVAGLFGDTRGSTSRRYEQTAQHDDDRASFTDYIVQATHLSLAWYFRRGAYAVSFLLIFVLCFCVWLVPPRLVPDLLNTALLVRQIRNVTGDTMSTMFVARELVLNDGFSRMTGAQALTRLTGNQKDYLVSLSAFRLGADGKVWTGADNIDSPTMLQYESGMYQEGCVWRENPNDCTGPNNSTAAVHGLYKLLQMYYRGMDVIANKYSGTGQSTAKAVDGNPFYNVSINPSTVSLLKSDSDIHFILEQYQGKDIFNGMGWVSDLVNSYQVDLFDQMQQESNLLLSIFIIMVVCVFYLCIFRTAMARAHREINRTRAFVDFIPVHILSREEALLIKHFFVDEVEADAEEPGLNGL